MLITNQLKQRVEYALSKYLHTRIGGSQFKDICESLIYVFDCEEGIAIFGKKLTIDDKPCSMFLNVDGGVDITVDNRLIVGIRNGEVTIEEY